MQPGDKIIYIGNEYNELVNGKLYTVRWCSINNDTVYVSLKERNGFRLYYGYYFITPNEYRKNKLLKLKEKIYVKRTEV